MEKTYAVIAERVLWGGRLATGKLAVLVSGGLDSAILLAETLHHHQAVFPLYIRTGLHWEGVELQHLRRFLEAVHDPALQPLHVLDLPVADLYDNHWSITG